MSKLKENSFFVDQTLRFWRKADLRVAECEDRIRAIKRNGAKGWEEEIAKEKMLLLELKAKRLHINIKLSKLSPLFDVGEEIH